MGNKILSQIPSSLRRRQFSPVTTIRYFMRYFKSSAGSAPKEFSLLKDLRAPGRERTSFYYLPTLATKRGIS